MTKRIFTILTILSFTACFSVYASLMPSFNYKKTYTEAEKYFNSGNYSAALPLFIQLDSAQKGIANVNYKIGFCYLNAPTYKTKSIPYFLEAVKNISDDYHKNDINEVQAPHITYSYLAKAYQLNYEFDKAIAMYLKYKETLGTGRKLTVELEEVMHNIETCNNGKELVKDPKDAIITNLGAAVNSPYPDYSPVISFDERTLIFTSQRKGGSSDVMTPKGQYFEDIYYSTFQSDRWTPAKTIGPNINTMGHEGSVNLSKDGLKLFIYKDDGSDGNLYLSENNGDEWGVPQYLGADINSFSNETHACFSSDNRILYFVSDRAGGYGGSDIYKCLKLPNGEWGPAQNLGPIINTKYDEESVFIHPNGKDIFFSSKGHKTMGGFDIFKSIIDNENGYLAAPLNVGYPINTPDDEVFFKTTADGKRAYYSSDKAGGLGDKDIYLITYSENEQRDVTLIIGKIVNNTRTDIDDNLIVVTDMSNSEIVQELTANSATGKFGVDLPIGTTYKIQYYIKGKEIYSEVVDAQKGKGYIVMMRDIPYNGQ